ncbi:MAG: sodium:solute symporter [Calditrichaeota bacterium]|nr:MAG: sodium:solute symporter [Calditrichota bacterium]MBL1205910.1 sodium:solute symporter [Calditrichota bacterium]
MSAFLGFIVIYGTWKSKRSKNLQEFLLANKSTPWYMVTLSIMATQASAITFLSTPGQAFVDGMRFVQFYIGLPIAMIILSITAVPIYHKMNAFTAYEYLETRFDLKNRALGSILFLIQRGLAAGFTILAPALILSVLLGWDLNATIIVIGILVIIYTATGGTDAVNKTHLLQMGVIFFGMIAAFVMIFRLLPDDISVLDALHIAGKSGKLNAIDFTFDLGNKYTFWSGLIGGTFLALSYFGTDQSQVQRYLSGSSIAQSRTGLLMNGIVKIPMQFFILLIGAMVFVFYQFVEPPLYFNPVEEQKVHYSEQAGQYEALEKNHKTLHSEKQDILRSMLSANDQNHENKLLSHQQEVLAIEDQMKDLRQEAKTLITQANPASDGNDTNFIFLTFVTSFLPIGLIGLVLAAILSASMSSTSAELNALASTTVVDIYKRMLKPGAPEKHYLFVSKASTVFWGIYAIGFALFANQLGTLIEAVNILGSLFYGTILGIFLIAFYFKNINGTATFLAALISEVYVFGFFFFTDIPYLWFNFIGCTLVVILAFIFEYGPVKNRA